jgi:hypothetical protein
MFTLRERLIASDAWLRTWILGALGLALYSLVASLEFSATAFKSPLYVALTLLAALVTILLTLLLSPLLAIAVFDGMIERQIRRNGGPFSIGDRVVVITGRCAGRTGVINSYGQCQTLRVKLDGETSEHGSYSHYQLKRAGHVNGES